MNTEEPLKKTILTLGVLAALASRRATPIEDAETLDDVGATYLVKVIVNHPRDPARTGAAQVVGIAPDMPSNDQTSIDVL